MAKRMNWDRVRLEKLMARYGRADFRVDQMPRIIPDKEIRDPRQQGQTAAMEHTVRGRRAAIRYIVKKIDEQEFGELEYQIERWISASGARRVTEVVSKLGDEGEYFFQLILKKMTKRQEAMGEAFQKILEGSKANEVRRARKREKKRPRNLG